MAHVINAAEDELICDLAEFYHIYDYQALPVQYVATLVQGLRNDSRTTMKINHVTCSQKELLLASIADRLSLLVWFQTNDGHKSRNRPRMLTDALLDIKPKRNQEKPMAFRTKEELDAALAAFTKEVE